MKFQREKITTGWDITKNVEGGGFRPPALLGLIKIGDLDDKKKIQYLSEI